jgi:hypothetical protein
LGCVTRIRLRRRLETWPGCDGPISMT